MKHILNRLSGYEITGYHHWRDEASFGKIRLLRESADALEEETLYIGHARQAPHKLPHSSACLLIDDASSIDKDYSYALFSDDTDLLCLYDDCVAILQDANIRRSGSEKLLQALIADKGLPELVKISSELLENPLMVMDSAFNLLAVSTRQEQKSVVWMDFINNGYCSQEHVYNFRKQGHARMLADSKQPIILPAGDRELPRSLAHKITYRDKTIGYIGLLESNRSFTARDLEMVEQLANVFSAEMQKTHSYDTFIGGVYESFMLDLLGGNRESRVTAGYFQVFNGDLYQYFYVAAIPISRQDAAHNQVQYLRTRIENSSGKFHTAYFNDNVVILISLGKQEDLASHTEKLDSVLEAHQLSCGLSFCFENLFELKKHYEEALRASKTGRTRKLPGRIHSYDDLCIYDMLISVQNTINLESCVHPALKKVEEYDEAYGTDYFPSLYKYLRYGGNITLTAKDLHIHRNTMVHRVGKLHEITGLDLEDGEVRTRLMLSYKIFEITRNVHY